MKEFMRATVGNPAALAVMFAGCFVFVFVACLLHYREEMDREKRKDTLAQWVTLDMLFALGIGIALWMV